MNRNRKSDFRWIEILKVNKHAVNDKIVKDMKQEDSSLVSRTGRDKDGKEFLIVYKRALV